MCTHKRRAITARQGDSSRLSGFELHFVVFVNRVKGAVTPVHIYEFLVMYSQQTRSSGTQTSLSPDRKYWYLNSQMWIRIPTLPVSMKHIAPIMRQVSVLTGLFWRFQHSRSGENVEICFIRLIYFAVSKSKLFKNVYSLPLICVVVSENTSAPTAGAWLLTTALEVPRYFVGHFEWRHLVYIGKTKSITWSISK